MVEVRFNQHSSGPMTLALTNSSVVESSRISMID